MGQHLPVKRDYQHIGEHSGGAHFLYHRFGNVGIAPEDAIALARLDLDINLCTPLRQVQYLGQRRYLLRFGPATGKMRGDVEAAQFVKVQVEDIACPIGKLFNRVIMKDDGMTIARHMHVEFYGINGKGERVAKRGQRVLRARWEPPRWATSWMRRFMNGL